MRSSMPFVAMVMAVLAQVTNMMATKLVISRGISTFVLAVYSGAFSSLALLPYALFFHCTFGRSDHPPITFSILFRIFLIALIGTLGLITGYTVGGAFIVTFYKGPPILLTSSHSGSPYQLLSPQLNWILGGFLLACESLTISLWLILQTSTLKKYPAELMIVFYNCCFVTVQSAVVALIAERDPRSWRLGLDTRLIAVLYIAVIGTAFRISVTTWCLGRTGPLFVSMFKPLAIVVAIVLGVVFLGDVFYFGSLVGALVIVTGFYTVVWGKAKEEKVSEDGGVQNFESTSPNAPLLKNRREEI
ncbi:hypothetical protein F0562_033350 [Nyssa sinensis]|uniref:WAT1-related protein n=1 Tax=Nyssa sinensis TaxID=561372 RepID=A0A5J5AUK7_9ASTE|nr:hypothetical protein F0562_033350 [Nyssa sinensis]